MTQAVKKRPDRPVSGAVKIPPYHRYRALRELFTKKFVLLILNIRSGPWPSGALLISLTSKERSLFTAFTRQPAIPISLPSAESDCFAFYAANTFSRRYGNPD